MVLSHDGWLSRGESHFLEVRKCTGSFKVCSRLGWPLPSVRLPRGKHCSHRRIPNSYTHSPGGIILVAERINGSLSRIPEDVGKVLNFIQVDNRLEGLRMTQSPVTPEDESIYHGHTSILLLVLGKMHHYDGIMSVWNWRRRSVGYMVLVYYYLLFSWITKYSLFNGADYSVLFTTI